MNDRRNIPLREPAKVMRLARLGSLHQCRLSFMRQLTRRMASENWVFSRPVFEIDENSVGHAVYTVETPERCYSLVAFAHDLPDKMRSDRVIAEAWDATFTLFDGVPDADDIERLRANVPLQEAGRVGETELSLSRANRSARLWRHVVDALAQGRQPDPDTVDSVGYLMRTTAVYGSGKFGAADRARIADRPETSAPFQAEMLSVYLTRCFVRDLIEHAARAKGGEKAAALDPKTARSLGIGNSTGLGMAPFIVNHPVLFNNWIVARETALQRVRSVQQASSDEVSCFQSLMKRSAVLVQRWSSAHQIQLGKLSELRADIATLETHLSQTDLSLPYSWDELVVWSDGALSLEGQELLASLILEPYGRLIDDLGDTMADNRAHAGVIDGSLSVGRTCDLIRSHFEWAESIDWVEREYCARAWYVSEEKLEPRLGERFEEPIAEYEQPLAPARDAAAALTALSSWDAKSPVAEFLVRHPEHRHTIRRAHLSQIAPYGEIADNTIASDVLPIDMLRAKLSFFGATHFDPRSDRWVRISMYSGAPYPEELNGGNADLWVYPEAAL